MSDAHDSPTPKIIQRHMSHTHKYSIKFKVFGDKVLELQDTFQHGKTDHAAAWRQHRLAVTCSSLHIFHIDNRML